MSLLIESACVRMRRQCRRPVLLDWMLLPRATSMIRSGEAELAIAGGADAPITQHSLPRLSQLV